MSLWKIAWRSIQQRGLSSSLTALSMALGVALVVAVLVVHGVIEQSFGRGAHGYHMVVGAKQGRMDLVLNTVFHLGRSAEPLPYRYYKEFTPDGPQDPSNPDGPRLAPRFAASVDAAIPYCLGDNYAGYRVVATIPDLFEKIEYGAGRKYRFAAGRNFAADHFFEAVVGAVAARETGLKVGDRFQPSHSVPGEEAHDHDPFTVVGVLAPTGTPNDRALFINMEGFYLTSDHAKPAEDAAPTDAHAHHDDHAHDEGHEHDASGHDEAHAGVAESEPHDAHDHAQDAHAEDAHAHDAHDHHGHGHHHGHAHHHEPLPESQREVTAILLRAKNDLFAMSLEKNINEDVEAMAVYPSRVVIELMNTLVDPLRIILLVLTVLVVIVAGVGIMVGIYNSMSERRREIAVMRALGAGRSSVMCIVLLESIVLAVGGGLIGALLGHGLVGMLSPYIAARTGVSIGFFEFALLQELVLLPALVLLAALAGFLPALAAYRTDVAKALTASP